MKIILSTAIILGAMSVQATTTVIVDSVSMIKPLSIQDEFTEISTDSIPVAVKSTIVKSFPDSKLEKAYKNIKNEYKLEIIKDDKKYIVFTDASGNVIKK
jgi:hypothetical protein